MKWPWRRKKIHLVIDDRYQRRLDEDKLAYWTEYFENDPEAQYWLRKGKEADEDNR